MPQIKLYAFYFSNPRFNDLAKCKVARPQLEKLLLV